MSRLKGCLRIGLYLILGMVGLILVLVLGWSWNTNRQLEASEQFAAAEDAPGQIIPVANYDLHVQTLGDAANPPLLLIHGFGVEGGAYWDEFAVDLAQDHYVIMPDLLGFGHSERVAEPVAAYSHTGQAELLAGLLDGMGVGTVSVIGASYGGGVAAELALAQPERVEHLVLIGAQTYELGGGFFETLVTLPLGLGRAMTWTAQGAGPRSEALATMGCGEGGGYCPSEAELADRLRLAQIEGTTDALVAFTNTPDNARIPAALGDIQQHTLLIWGEVDSTIPLENGLRLDKDIPDSELIVMPGLNHSPYKEAPQETATLVRSFLGGHSH